MCLLSLLPFKTEPNHTIPLIREILKKKKKYKLTYLQNRKRVTDVENKLMVTKEGKGCGGRMNWEVGADICTSLLIYKKITNSTDMK